MAISILLRLKLYLRLKPFDISTPVGLDMERNRIALVTMIASAMNKAMAMLTVLAGISWTLPYLGSERFGGWMTLLSMAALLSVLDLGAGNALVNHLAKHRHEGKQSTASALSGGLGVVALLAIVMWILLNLIHPILPWASILKVKDPENLIELTSAFRIFYTLFALQLFANAVGKAATGMQQAHQFGFLSLVISVFGLALLYMASINHLGIAWLLSITLGAPVSSGFVYFLLLWKRGLFQFKGLPKQVILHWRDVLSVGGLFFILQIAVIVGWGADSLVIASTLGVGSVTMYAVAQRMYQLATQPFSIVNSSLWAAYADAHVKNNRVYVRQLFSRSFMTSLILGGLIVGVIYVASPVILKFISKSHLSPDPLFFAIFAVWALIEIVGNSLGTMLNGIGVVRYQVIVSGLFAVCVMPFKFVLINRYGLNGLMLANVVCYLFLIAVPYAMLFKLRKISL
ncbi:oligosaccharide flippase family protein [Limnobacter litoralis]|nr:oligosaccharide flippase family protein [Limnobacter litoralis]